MEVSQLLIYPVKSLRGFSIDSALLTPQGLEYDRQWMIINQDNKFVSQRKFSHMVLLHTAMENNQLIISAPHHSSLPPLVIDSTKKPTGEAFDAMVWKDTCQVLDEGINASEWLSEAIGSHSPLRLVRMANKQRPQSKPELLGENTHTYFADAAPLLIANEQSLMAVNKQLKAAKHNVVPMENFRPNIVLSGINAFDEHQIKLLEHPNYQLTPCYPCQRCIIPTIDIKTGVRHPKQQPFSLIADINPMPDNDKAPAFGENAVITTGVGKRVNVGDKLTAHY